MASERDDLLPGRISGDYGELLEKFALVSVILTSIVAVAMGAYYGASTGHHEHVVMGFIVAASLGQFLWITRLYYKDVLQEKRLVYYSWFTMLLIAAGGLMYSVHWGIVPPTAEQQALDSCSAGGANSCYNPSINPASRIPGVSPGCMHFPASLVTPPGENPPGGTLCQIFNPNGLSWSYAFAGNGINVTAQAVQATLRNCNITGDKCLTQAFANASNCQELELQKKAQLEAKKAELEAQKAQTMTTDPASVPQ